LVTRALDVWKAAESEFIRVLMTYYTSEPFRSRFVVTRFQFSGFITAWGGHVPSNNLSYIIYTLNPTIHPLPSISRPPMIPPVPRRKIRLQSRILHGHAPPNPPLDHCTAVQPAHIPALASQGSRIGSLPARLMLLDNIAPTVQEPQVLARRAHAHVLALELEGLGGAPAAQE
jgi:hypothetical protein